MYQGIPWRVETDLSGLAAFPMNEQNDPIPSNCHPPARRQSYFLSYEVDVESQSG